MKLKILFALAGVVLFAGAGCRGYVAEKALETASGGKVDIEDGGKQIKVTTQDGTAQWGGDNKLPEGWPSDAPIYPGATIQFSGNSNPTDGKTGFSVILETNDSGQAVQDFYKKELAAQGWNIEGTYQAGEITTIVAKKDESTFGLTIATSEGQTAVTIAIEK